MLAGAAAGAVYGGLSGGLKPAFFGAIAGGILGGVGGILHGLPYGDIAMLIVGAGVSYAQEGLDGLLYFAGGLAGGVLGFNAAKYHQEYWTEVGEAGTSDSRTAKDPRYIQTVLYVEFHFLLQI